MTYYSDPTQKSPLINGQGEGAVGTYFNGYDNSGKGYYGGEDKNPYYQQGPPASSYGYNTTTDQPLQQTAAGGGAGGYYAASSIAEYDAEFGQRVTYVWYQVGLPVCHTDKNRFLCKVMGCVLFQLLVTAVVAIPIFLSRSAHEAFVDNSWIMIVGWVSSLFILILLFLLRHKPVLNMLCLILFSGAIAISVAAVCVQYAAYQIIEAFVITFAVVLCLVMITLVAKVDLQMFAACIIVFLCYLMWWFLFWFLINPAFYEYTCVQLGGQWYCESVANYSVWGQVWAGLGVALFLGYLMFDLSRIQRNCHHDEWMLGAVTIYVDIIMFFLFLLALLGGRK